MHKLHLSIQNEKQKILTSLFCSRSFAVLELARRMALVTASEITLASSSLFSILDCFGAFRKIPALTPNRRQQLPLAPEHF